MNRKFIINLVFAVSINLLIKPFWVLGVERGVQNALGAEAYGFYFSLFSFTFLFNVILDFGINNYNNSFIAKYPHLLSKKFSQLMMLKMLLVLVYILITFFIALIAGYEKAQFRLLFILCLNQVLSFLVTYLRTNISGLHFFITDSLLSVVDRLLMIIFCSLLLWGNIFGEMRLEWFVYSQTLSYGITAGLCFFILRPHLHNLNWQWNKAFTFHLLKKSYPYAVLGILMGFYSKMDGVLVERLLANGKIQAGHYASAYRLLDAANMIAVLFAALLLPVFSRLLQSKDAPDSLLKLSFTLLIAPAILGASVCYFYSGDLIFLLNKTHNTEIEQVLMLLMLSFVFTCVVYIYGTFLTAAGNLKLLNRIALFAVIINFVLNVVLIRSHGIRGAAFSALITQGIVGISHYLFTHRKFSIPVDYTLLLKLGIFTTIQIVTPVLLKFSDFHFFVKIILQTVICILALLILKIISLHQLNSLIIRK